MLRFQRRKRLSPASASTAGRAASTVDSARILPDGELPANLRFLLTPDHDPTLDYLDTLPDLELLDDTEREARIAVARLTGS